MAAALRDEFESAGKLRQYELLRGALSPDRDQLPYAQAAAELGLTEEAVRQSGHRLRKRYRELLRREVAQTVEDPGEVDDEIRRLFEALGA